MSQNVNENGNNQTCMRQFHLAYSFHLTHFQTYIKGSYTNWLKCFNELLAPLSAFTAPQPFRSSLIFLINLIELWIFCGLVGIILTQQFFKAMRKSRAKVWWYFGSIVLRFWVSAYYKSLKTPFSCMIGPLTPPLLPTTNFSSLSKLSSTFITLLVTQKQSSKFKFLFRMVMFL